ncbi:MULTISPECIES: anthrone oxygenase family protein [unclassified Streptomyces]|uniref:anthrone oxygenase family protein n=1 Tax=unclassified Streptomyces TaxID=2593676 RepID=UPI00288854AE|nr:anthrone oxygenase family protein [Streptomyces sp. DSM 41633]
MNPNPAGSPQHYSAGGPSPYQTQPGPYAPPQPHSPAPAGRGKAATALLLVSTILMGLMAGLFFAFDVSVMPGLAAGDERTYVTAMQNFNAAIDGNAIFGMAFVLALLASAASAIVEFRKGRRTVAIWVGAATVAYFLVLMITFSVNIPLNNELADAGDAAQLSDFSIVDKFKGTWVSTNIVRTLLCTAALTALSRALVLYGRATR